jgi:hypothetical protein
VGGEGSQRWKLVQENGNRETNPFVRRSAKLITLSESAKQAMPWRSRLLNGTLEKTYGSLPFTSDSNPAHMSNWFECLRTRKQPNATIENGYAHSVAVIMAARAQRESRKLYWDPRTEQILDTPPPPADQS